jgi:hypothetical protein
MSVVLVGPSVKWEMDVLADAVEQRGSEAVVVDVGDWPGETPLTFRPGADDATVDATFDFDDVEGAYFYAQALFRPHDVTCREEFKGREDVQPVLNQWREHRSVFESLCRTFESRGVDVLPRLDNHYLQQRKPWQLDRFEAAGVPVPDTVFTNDPDEVRAFCDRHDRVLYKPVSRGATPSEVEGDDLDERRLAKLSAAPVQFQAFVPGEDLRVYVLDGDVVGAIRYHSERFSFKLDQEAGDDVELSAPSVSPAVEESAVRAADAADVQFAAADVRRRPDGSHALLELNEAPAFAAADVRADQSVGAALAEYLTGR